jgi:hypothetical protein
LSDHHETNSHGLGERAGLRESQLKRIVCSGLPPHANLLFFCANRAAVDIWSAKRHLPHRRPGASRREMR